MLSQANNELLTRVEGDAPMGQLIRKWSWIPFALPSELKPYDAPLKVRLLGSDYVAWRTPEGKVGFIDQACPHRRVSMALARNEGCVLRCIFHGWTVHADGYVEDAPSHYPDAKEFASRVKVAHYPTFEAGDMVWVYLGQGDPPPRPRLPFTEMGDDHVYTTRTMAYCNYLQGVEGSLDTAHLTWLHRSFIPKLSPRAKDGSLRTGDANPILTASAPRYEVRRTPWGMTAVGMRDNAKGKVHVRASQFVAPFITIIPSYPYGNGNFFAMVPVDDHNHIFFNGFFSLNSKVDENWPPLQMTLGNGRLVKENYAPLLGGTEINFGQDRVAMSNGHFTGFPNNLVEEDMVVQVSMGSITDRSKENLSSSDFGLVQMRMMMLRALKNDAEGKHPLAPNDGDFIWDDAMPIDAVIPPDGDLDALLTRQREAASA
jgi:phenylpropionate dioxygenase-like ring-hydroxylating dioxygenase large terminal subunit